jgi:hypothetical protein
MTLLALMARMTLPALGQSKAAPKAASREAAPTEAVPVVAAACPWLALGTASGLLGVSASVQVQSAEGRSGSCLFVPTQAKPESDAASPRLMVSVTTAAPSPCSGHAKRLSGIGNEAEECWVSERSHAPQEILTGRVRDRWFAVEGTNLPAESVRAGAPQWKGEPVLPTPLEVAAEQVAGNLY